MYQYHLKVKQKQKVKEFNHNVSIKDIYKINKKVEYLHYEGYMQKRSKHVPTESYLLSSKTDC